MSLAFATSIFFPLQLIEQKDAGVGESAKANQILDKSFDLDQTGQFELVVIQSKTKTVDDPAFRAVINESLTVLRGFPKVEKLRAPLAAGNEGQISPDRHAVLITFQPRGNYDEAAKYIDTIAAATAGVQKAHPGFYVGEAGVSTEKSLEKLINGGVAQAGMIALPLTILILLLVLGSLVGRVRARPGRADFGLRDHGARRDREPVRPDGRTDSGSRPADRARSRRRLHALLPAS